VKKTDAGWKGEKGSKGPKGKGSIWHRINTKIMG